MSLIRHIEACNAWDPGRFLALYRFGQRIGFLRTDHAARLRRFPAVFDVGKERAELVAEGGPETLTAAVDDVVEALVTEGAVDKWRHEQFAVKPLWHAPPLFNLDRGAVPFFGIRAYGVHLNGWRRGEDGAPALWIGRRARDKKVAPGKLDNMVAGGIGAGYTVGGTLTKEAEEEASVPPAMIGRAQPVGALSYRMANAQGLRDDVLFLYDLEVPADFTPRNTDGEIEEFRLMPAAEALARVRAGDDFKFNVSLVIIDFALRHGLITPDDPDYLAIATRLRRPLD